MGSFRSSCCKNARVLKNPQISICFTVLLVLGFFYLKKVTHFLHILFALCAELLTTATLHFYKKAVTY